MDRGGAGDSSAWTSNVRGRTSTNRRVQLSRAIADRVEVDQVRAMKLSVAKQGRSRQGEVDAMRAAKQCRSR
ncbi:hypothetical protein NDU88_003930 [Pleurodeles waltl]|uniref:Uncharacterized protein n=1 Tax=Pleurodeles waltl TaxID=8319 RepID=A0AAV7RJW3_PLEWA|nr:hypothetical protein NDU88_003930 [Pleurodeles waltl]